MPKLYFAGKNVEVPHGAEVHIKYSYGSVFQTGSKLTSSLSGAIDEGRVAVESAITHMQQGGTNGVNANFKKWAAKYFLVDSGGPSSEEFNTILAVLKLTHAGINNTGLSVKVFKSKDSTLGYVTSYLGDKAANQEHRTPGMWNKGDGTMKQAVKGDIKLSVGGILQKQLLSAALFVHEATHKFANTADFGEKGYTDPGTGAFRKSGLVKEQALMNADSYARFAIHFYRGENGMKQW